MTRTNAREIACHLVYEMYLNDITAGEALTALMDEGYYPSLKSESDVYEEKPTGKQLEYLENVVQGVQAKRAELEGYLEKYAIGWSVGPRRSSGTFPADRPRSTSRAAAWCDWHRGRPCRPAHPPGL